MWTSFLRARKTVFVAGQRVAYPTSAFAGVMNPWKNGRFIIRITTSDVEDIFPYTKNKRAANRSIRLRKCCFRQFR
jgi:hypothetical protein